MEAQYRADRRKSPLILVPLRSPTLLEYLLKSKIIGLFQQRKMPFHSMVVLLSFKESKINSIKLRSYQSMKLVVVSPKSTIYLADQQSSKIQKTTIKNTPCKDF